MLKSCSICGGVHDRKDTCPKYKPREKAFNIVNRFRSSSAWRKKSVEIRVRDLYLCLHCKHKGRYEFKDLEVHHIVPIASNFDLRLHDGNLITLCAPCHTLAEKGDISRELLLELSKKRNESGISYER